MASSLARVLVLGLCVLLAPAASRASNNCPWMNEATASGLLGGDAMGEFTPAAAGQAAVCLFTYDSPGAKRILRIMVETSADAHERVTAAAETCGRDADALKAIGNEAVECAADERKGGMGESAVGRVRDQVFTIAIGSSLKSDPILPRDALKARIRTAAEQVAGNLF